MTDNTTDQLSDTLKDWADKALHTLKGLLDDAIDAARDTLNDTDLPGNEPRTIRWVPTHRSTKDGSTARLVSTEGDDWITLENEDGEQFPRRASDWELIPDDDAAQRAKDDLDHPDRVVRDSARSFLGLDSEPDRSSHQFGIVDLSDEGLASTIQSIRHILMHPDSDDPPVILDAICDMVGVDFYGWADKGHWVPFPDR